MIHFRKSMNYIEPVILSNSASGKFMRLDQQSSKQGYCRNKTSTQGPVYGDWKKTAAFTSYRFILIPKVTKQFWKQK